MITVDDARAKLTAHDQQQVLRFFEQLDDAGKARLLADIEALDLDWLARVFAHTIDKVNPADIAPYEDVVRVGADDEADAIARGEEALRAGRVGVLLVAGGQGTRLGFDGPKGDFPVGAVSNRTLFELHCARLCALGQRYGVVPPLYLMTGPSNHEDTLAIFERGARYGMPEDRLMIFQQGTAPCVDERGKLLLDAPDHIACSPNGNGGLFAAMRDSGAFAHMRSCGVEHISYIQVDNALAQSADPRFVGYHLARESQFSCKAMPKADPMEKVGQFTNVRGRLAVVEYTEIPEDLARERRADGELRIGWGNPGIFMWSRRFAEAQADRADLPFHKAHKKIPHLDDAGTLVEPSTPCGYKLEAFAFDTLDQAERSLILACERDAEFAPVKNKDGVDSPASARALMTKLYRGWIEAAGGRVSGEGPIEIDARYALDAGELRSKLGESFETSGDLYLK
ncbi:MAG: UTP--glucose-1-phosphate uridylyltransferase [Myxococcales bacterium]|nr:UTP--glucose-1-phosphate uridylyltransferase [Myxococcales bacterium]